MKSEITLVINECRTTFKHDDKRVFCETSFSFFVEKIMVIQLHSVEKLLFRQLHSTENTSHLMNEKKM